MEDKIIQKDFKKDRQRKSKGRFVGHSTPKIENSLPASDLLEMAEHQMVRVFELMSEFEYESLPILESLKEEFEIEYDRGITTDALYFQNLFKRVFDSYRSKVGELSFLQELKDSGYPDYPYKTLEDSGYVMIYTHDLKYSKAEHRYIYEKYSGETLNKYTVVHHINRNRSDNRFENLQAMTRSQHSKLHGKKENRTKKELRLEI